MINDFGSKEHDQMIPSYLFDDSESKHIALIDVPLSIENEKVSKRLLKILKAFTKENCDFRIVREKKIDRQRFPFMEKNPYPSCKIYEEVCSSKENYIVATKWNVVTHWNKHENPNKDSEPAKHLFQHPDHVF